MSTRGNDSEGVLLRIGDTGVVAEIAWYGITDTGYRREINQDSYTTVAPIWAVADGMGGHEAGEVASAAVARRLTELGGMREITDADVISALSDAVDDIELNTGDSAVGAGTTVTGVYLGDANGRAAWRVFNIGDSRVYHYGESGLEQVTVDHSVVQHLIDTGAISPSEAETHPHANVITRAVGFNEEPIPDFVWLPLKAGQRILICSDGLTKELTDRGIETFLQDRSGAQVTAESLLRAALMNSGRDNITVVVIDVLSVEP